MTARSMESFGLGLLVARAVVNCFVILVGVANWMQCAGGIDKDESVEAFRHNRARVDGRTFVCCTNRTKLDPFVQGRIVPNIFRQYDLVTGTQIVQQILPATPLRR